ncbi:DUF423 domain-containing protein [Consotaella salsifontis]|uniref:Uncharacterized membrane protein YgdD, TMEM256/DUF423 family n=1 Tax=Consotaella salsifontis TaxID=1365950 RepID=A0A1T4NPF3_9HYPH|nr:DUF423 domain-containing protein [Consotaella salsifontis]SJZ81093.1 Uncharacterized membrane protein YgdD, TMEM256/DUF423 family [Consotaella salsifontis]
MNRTVAAIILFVAGLLGAGGVAGLAYAAHGGGDTHFIASAAGIAVAHAPILAALALARPGALRGAWLAAMLLAIGAVLFSGDLTMRTFIGDRLFPYAAPTGGLAMIAGWLTISLGAIANLFTEPAEPRRIESGLLPMDRGR